MSRYVVGACMHGEPNVAFGIGRKPQVNKRTVHGDEDDIGSCALPPSKRLCSGSPSGGGGSAQQQSVDAAMVPKASQIKCKELFARMIFEKGFHCRVSFLQGVHAGEEFICFAEKLAHRHCLCSQVALPSLSAILQAIGHKSFSRNWLAGPGLNQAYDWEVKQQKVSPCDIEGKAPPIACVWRRSPRM